MKRTISIYYALYLHIIYLVRQCTINDSFLANDFLNVLQYVRILHCWGDLGRRKAEEPINLKFTVYFHRGEEGGGRLNYGYSWISTLTSLGPSDIKRHYNSWHYNKYPSVLWTLGNLPSESKLRLKRETKNWKWQFFLNWICISKNQSEFDCLISYLVSKPRLEKDQGNI